MRKVVLRPTPALLLACIVTLGFVFGCTREWYVTIVAFNNGQPEFCFSRSPGCHGEGVKLESLVVDEVDEHGNRRAVAWSIQAHSNLQQDYVVKHLVYGQVPNGWVQVQSPSPLRANVYYSLHGEFYFVLSGTNTPRMYTREEFSKREREM